MIIETERLLLRPFGPDDAEDVYAYLHEPAVHCFACMKLDTPADAQKEMEARRGETEYLFAITLKETGRVIGEIDAYPETAEPHAAEDAPRDTFSPCWMLHEPYQGKGYACEAARAFFAYLFREKGARRIYAYTEDYNLPSQRLCEKLGMRLEGEFREFVSFVSDEHGAPIYENTRQYAILKKEWDAREFVFRPALREETEEVLRLWESVKGSPFGTWNEYYPVREDAENDLSSGGLFVLREAGALVGAVSAVAENELDSYPCWQEKKNAREFARVAVAASRQGRGFGKRLVSGILGRFREEGVRAVHIAVAKVNLPAQRLYRGFGFTGRGEADMYGNRFLLCELIL